MSHDNSTSTAKFLQVLRYRETVESLLEAFITFLSRKKVFSSQFIRIQSPRRRFQNFVKKSRHTTTFRRLARQVVPAGKMMSP